MLQPIRPLLEAATHSPQLARRDSAHGFEALVGPGRGALNGLGPMQVAAALAAGVVGAVDLDGAGGTTSVYATNGDLFNLDRVVAELDRHGAWGWASPVAVNFEPSNVSPEAVRYVARHHCKRHLGFEVTERGTFQELLGAVQQLADLSEHVAVDDVGALTAPVELRSCNPVDVITANLQRLALAGATVVKIDGQWWEHSQHQRTRAVKVANQAVELGLDVVVERACVVTHVELQGVRQPQRVSVQSFAHGPKASCVDWASLARDEHTRDEHHNNETLAAFL